MKTKILRGIAITAVLAGLPFVVGSIQSPKDGLPEEEGRFAQSPADSSPVDAELVDAPEAEDPGSPAIAVKPPVPEVKVSAQVAEVVKLAQSGVNEDVMMAFVTNANSRFNLGSDQIIYLNDIGVSPEVVKAMIQRDTTLNASSAQATAASVPTVDVPLPPEQTNNVPPAYPPTDVVEQPPPAEPYNPTYVNYTDGSDGGNSDAYFYDSLQPYGSWVYVNGYGRCWQPTVCVVNRDWRPYCDRGRWLNTDSGWYWQSDYSWGWAPFHYGRWFCDDNRGWVWCPGRTWGPAWVSWRRSSDYCGWAPLPPEARFARGGGFRYWNHSVGVNFEFGLRANHYTFLPVNRFCDPNPWRHRVSHTQVAQVYNHTTVINNITVKNNTIINQGIDPKLVAAASHTKIHKTIIQELPKNGPRTGRPDRLDQSGNKLLVYRPHLPTTASTTRGANAFTGKTTGAAGGAKTVIAPQGPKQVGSPSKFNGSREPVRANTIVPIITRKDPVVTGNAAATVIKPTTATPGFIRPQTASTTAGAPVNSSIAANLPVKDSAHVPILPAFPNTASPGAGINKFKSGNEVLPPNSLVWTGKKPATTLQPVTPTPAPIKTAFNNDKPGALPPVPTANLNPANHTAQTPSTYKPGTGFQPLNQPGHISLNPKPTTQSPLSKPVVNHVAPTTPHAPDGWIQPVKPYSSYTQQPTAPERVSTPKVSVPSSWPSPPRSVGSPSPAPSVASPRGFSSSPAYSAPQIRPSTPSVSAPVRSQSVEARSGSSYRAPAAETRSAPSVRSAPAESRSGASSRSAPAESRSSAPSYSAPASRSSTPSSSSSSGSSKSKP